MNGRNFQRQYKDKLSNFRSWKQGSHAEDYIVYPKNLDAFLSIDETSLSNGELYPDIEKAYKPSCKLYQIYNQTSSPEIARAKLTH